MGMLGDSASEGALVARSKANSKAAIKTLNGFPDISHLLQILSDVAPRVDSHPSDHD